MIEPPRLKVQSPTETTQSGSESKFNKWWQKQSEYWKGFVVASVISSAYLALFIGVLIDRPTDPGSFLMGLLYLLFFVIILFSTPFLAKDQISFNLGALSVMGLFTVIGYAVFWYLTSPFQVLASQPR